MEVNKKCVDISEIKWYCEVLLKNGSEASIVEILSDDTFIADIGDSPEDWETITIKIEEIEKVIYTPLK